METSVTKNDIKMCEINHNALKSTMQVIEANLKTSIELMKQSNCVRDEKLDEILKEVKLTNGRVTRLEQETLFLTWLNRKPYRWVLLFMLINEITNQPIIKLLAQFLN